MYGVLAMTIEPIRKKNAAELSLFFKTSLTRFFIYFGCLYFLNRESLCNKQ